MNTSLVTTFQELLKTGEKLIPDGGSESSGYNAKRQSTYLLWRKNCLDAVGVLREKGTVLFSRIANDENGMYFYQSSAQKISTVVTEALAIALSAPDPAAPAGKTGSRTRAAASPAPSAEEAADDPRSEAEAVTGLELIAESELMAGRPADAVAEPEPIDVPAFVEELELIGEPEPIEHPEAVAESVSTEPEAAGALEAVAESVSTEPEAAGALEAVAESVSTEPEAAGALEAVAESVSTEPEAAGALEAVAESADAPGAWNTADAALPMPGVEARGPGEDEEHSGAVRAWHAGAKPDANRYSADDVTVDAEQASAAASWPASGMYSTDDVTVDSDPVPAANTRPAAPTPVVLYSSSTHPMLGRLQNFFTARSMDCMLFSHTEGKWDPLETLQGKRPLPRYAVFLLSEEYREEELVALGYLAGKYPWLTVSCLHHKSLPRPALLPGISHREYADAFDEVTSAVLDDLNTAGYSLSL